MRMDKASAAYASVGHPVRRTEDERHLHGAGRFVADIPWPGALHLAFVRSTVAHGVVRAVRAPALAAGESFWTAADLHDLARPIVAKLNRPGFQAAAYPCLATDRVRFVGQTIAAVVASSRARAEDLAEQVEVDIDPLPVLLPARVVELPTDRPGSFHAAHFHAAHFHAAHFQTWWHARQPRSVEFTVVSEK